MKKQHHGKLALQRETLAALSANDLHEVNGGTLGPIIRGTVWVSQRVCTTVMTVQSQKIITCK